MKINKIFLWALVQRSSSSIVNFIFFLILARLMGPTQFGLITLALIWLGGFRVLGSSGLSGALIQAKGLTDSQLSSVFFTNLFVSAILVLVSSSSVWLFPVDQNMQILPLIVTIMSITLMISGLTLVQESLAYREMRFRFLAIRDLVSALVGGVVGVALALSDFGVWSLVAQLLSNSLTSLILLWGQAKWRPKWSEFSIIEVKPFLTFSLWLMAFELFAYLVKEIDKTMIGFLVGVSVLGIYTLANKVILLPSAIFTDALNSYLFPKLSSLQADPNNLSKVYLGSVSLTMTITTPVIFTLGMIVYEYGTQIMGSQWEGVNKMALYVAIIATCQSYISPAGSALKALGQVSLLFKWAVFVFTLMCLGVVGGSNYGLNGIMVGLVVVNFICAVATCRLLKSVVGVKPMLNQLAYFFLIILIGLSLAVATDRVLNAIDIGNIYAAVIFIMLVAMSYFFVATIIFKGRIGHYLKFN